MKLLVVEDDPPLQAALFRLLGQWGYACERAATAAEALAWLERDLVDLVLLDGLSRRIGEPLDDLLLLARQEQAGLEGPLTTVELQAFDLLELLEDLLRCYAPQAAVRSIRLQLQPDSATRGIPIRGQSEPLLRLFTNLLLNAIRHSPAGGMVSVRVSQAGHRILVTVTDQGPGIPEPARERVFERFWSGADRGGHSGLGLAIGRAIARRHGGELRLGESRPGRCEMVVELPAGTTDRPATEGAGGSGGAADLMTSS